MSGKEMENTTKNFEKSYTATMLRSIRTIKITVPEVISTKIGLQGKFRFSVFFEDFYRVPLSKFSKNRKFFCSPIYVEMSSGIGILIVLMLPNDAALYDL